MMKRNRWSGRNNQKVRSPKHLLLNDHYLLTYMCTYCTINEKKLIEHYSMVSNFDVNIFKRLITTDTFPTIKDNPNIVINGNYAPGVSDFAKFITSGTFVDKSLFIMEFM